MPEAEEESSVGDAGTSQFSMPRETREISASINQCCSSCQQKIVPHEIAWRSRGQILIIAVVLPLSTVFVHFVLLVCAVPPRCRVRSEGKMKHAPEETDLSQKCAR